MSARKDSTTRRGSGSSRDGDLGGTGSSKGTNPERFSFSASGSSRGNTRKSISRRSSSTWDVQQGLVRSIRDKLHRTAKVDLDELISFMFPPNLQHPLSSGRLYAFGMYGPLGKNGELRSGYKGTHTVQPWELDSLCLTFEREDILQVYIGDSRPLCVLNEAEKEDIIAQADSHLKTNKGRGYMRQITEKEVRALFEGLRRDEEGYISFHEAQRVILAYRANQIERAKVIFPNLVSSGGGGGRPVRRAPPPVDGQSMGHSSSSASTGTRTGGKDEGTTAAAAARRSVSGAIGTKTSLSSGGKSKRRRGRVSAYVAPPSMFQKDVGFTPNELASLTNTLLSTRAFKICNLSDGNNPSLVENVRLIREDDQDPARTRGAAGGGSSKGEWDKNCCVRRTLRGTHVSPPRRDMPRMVLQVS